MLYRIALLVAASLLCASQARAVDFYWVGGTGEWDDVGHWATTSGGATLHYGIPSGNDDVYIDANSFAAATESLDLLGLDAQCRSIYVTTAVAARVVGTGSLTVNGDFELAGALSWEFAGNVELRAGLSPSTIDVRGSRLGRIVTFADQGTGAFRVASDVAAAREIRILGVALSAVPGSRMQAINFEIETDGRVDYSGLTLVVRERLELAADPAEAASLASLNVLFRDGIRYDAEFDGLDPFPLGTMRVEPNASTPGQLDLTRGYSGAAVSTTTLKADSLVVAVDANYRLLFDVGYFEVAEATQHTFDRGGDFAVAEVVARGTCLTPILLVGTGGTRFTAPAGAPQALEYLFVTDHAAGGGAAWAATESAGAGSVAGWTFSATGGPRRYWVGDSGSWDDPAHWSNTSGGAGGACPPSGAHDAVFDAASFSGPGGVVTVPDGRWLVRDLDWSAADEAATLEGDPLTLYGSLLLYPDLTWDSREVLFRGDATGRLIHTHGRTERLSFDFGGTGDWRLVDSLSLRYSLWLSGGTLYTDDHPISLHSLTARVATGRIVFGSSRVHVYAGSGDLTNRDPVFDLGSGQSDASGVRLHVHDPTREIRIDLDHLPSATEVAIEAIVSEARVRFSVDAPLRAQLLDLRNSGEFRGAGRVDSLVLGAGGEYLFGGGTAQLDVGVFEADGTCVDGIALRATSATYTLNSTSPQAGSNLQIFNVAAAGATWTAQASLDLGGAAGWTFTAPSAARVLYWVGGTGTWFDPDHWSLSPGGPGGECPPTRLDDVSFTAASLLPGDTLYLAETRDVAASAGRAVECRTLDARALATPEVVFLGTMLSAYGSFYIGSGVTNYFVAQLLGDRPDLEFAVLGSPGRLGIRVMGPGTYTMLDHLVGPDVKLSIWGGTFATADHDLEVHDLEIRANGGMTSTLDAGSSEIVLHDDFWPIYMTGGDEARIANAGARVTVLSGGGTVYLTSAVDGLDLIFLGTTAVGIRRNSPVTSAGPSLGTVRFSGPASIADGIAIDSLVLARASEYVIGTSHGSGIAIGDYLYGVGSACSPITIGTAAGDPNGDFVFAPGAITEMDYVRLDRVDALGPDTYYAGRNSIDVANSSSGWSFESAPGLRTLDRDFLGPDINSCRRAPELAATVPPEFVATYEWSSGTTERTYTPPGPGTYWLRVTFEQGTCTLPDTVTVTAPAYDLLPDVDTAVCGTGDLRIDYPSSGGPFTLLAESGAIASTDPAGGEVVAPGTYHVTQTIGACTDSTTYLVRDNVGARGTSRERVCGPSTFSTPIADYAIATDTVIVERHASAASGGCDSLHEYRITIDYSAPISDSTFAACGPVAFATSRASYAGIVRDTVITETIPRAGGVCDSTRSYRITVTGLGTTADSAIVACYREPIVISGVTYRPTRDTTIIDAAAGGGCGGSLSYHVTVGGAPRQEQRAVFLCGPGSVVTDVATYYVTQDTVFEERFATAGGACDSLVAQYTVALSAGPQLRDTSATLCGPGAYATPQGTYTITRDTTFSEIYSAASGDCDSLVLTHHVVLGDTLETYATVLEWCGPDVLVTPNASHSIASDTAFTEVYASSSGCDSAARTFTVRVGRGSITREVPVRLCAQTTWSSDRETYSISGDTVIAERYQPAGACDSTIVYVLTYSEDSDGHLGEAIDASCAGADDGAVFVTAEGFPPEAEATLAGSPIEIGGERAGLPPGAYPLIITYGEGCSADTTFTIGAPLALEVTSSMDQLGRADLGLPIPVLVTGGEGAYSYSWLGKSDRPGGVAPGVTCPVCPSPALASAGDGELVVEVVDSNRCTARLTFEVHSPNGAYALHLPTAFSPNGDGINDRLTVYPDEVQLVDRIDWFGVFDRWGGLVAEGEDLAMEGETTLWDGGEAETGVYVLLCRVRRADGVELAVRGEVSLFR